VRGNALDLPFEDGSFDAATVGFGIRNVVDLPRALGELRRVVIPGGRVVVLEITTPERPPLSWFYAFWFDRIVPLLGALTGEHDAYSYLPESVKRFPPAAGLAKRMYDGGLRDVRYVILAGGIVAIHDDVLDAALLRRGRPTVYASEGRGLARATGDFLFSRAFALLAANGAPDQVRALSNASVALARGELEQREDAYAVDLPLDRYLRRCELKTASLFSTACRLGGLAAGRAPAEVSALAAYGRKVGVAFQMLDDLLDVSGPPERTGKHRGTDLLDGTVTLPLILAREEDPALVELELRGLERAQVEAVCDRIAATSALEHTRDWARSLVEEGKEELRGSVAPDLQVPLEEVADRVVERYS
jgi:geranylgeranyl pyrophosphate synthase